MLTCDTYLSPGTLNEALAAVAATFKSHSAKMETMQGFNVRRWSQQGMNFWAVSDIGADELAEFGTKFEAALPSSS